MTSTEAEGFAVYSGMVRARGRGSLAVNMPKPYFEALAEGSKVEAIMLAPTVSVFVGEAPASNVSVIRLDDGTFLIHVQADAPTPQLGEAGMEAVAALRRVQAARDDAIVRDSRRAADAYAAQIERTLAELEHLAAMRAKVLPRLGETGMTAVAALRGVQAARDDATVRESRRVSDARAAALEQLFGNPAHQPRHAT